MSFQIFSNEFENPALGFQIEYMSAIPYHETKQTKAVTT